VVPVYGVAGFLNECLDSILGQSYADLEVVAVDDCSPDRCGDILDEYAARDRRVRVLHLPANVGLGRARAAGLDACAGDYVWFVDSDDWVAPGAVRAIVARLRETQPDHLVINYARAWPTGATTIGGLDHFLPPATTPAVFTVRDRPRVLDVLHTAWGRVVRRDLIDRRDELFCTGWYEDVAFTLPLLVRSRRIATLHRVCYLYRQRPTGGITTTTSPRHFEVFDQYERMFATVRRWGVAADDPVLGHLWSRMLRQYRWILNGSIRVPPNLRAAFFHRMHLHYLRHRPTVGHQRRLSGVGRVDRLTWRLVDLDWWLAFRALRLLVRGVRATVGGLRAMAHRLRRAAGYVRHRARLAYYVLQSHLPLVPDLAVYDSYWGQGYGCNPAAIFEKARELAPQIRGVWVVARGHGTDIPADAERVRELTLAYYRALARATYLITNVNFPAFVRKRPGSVHVQTHHGTPLKVMGMDHARFPVGARGMDLADLLARCQRWDMSLSTSPFNTEVWQRAYPIDHDTIEVGYPRNDRLDRATPDEVAGVRAALGLSGDQRVLLYAPTHREYRSDCSPYVDLERLADELGTGTRILARQHHYDLKELGSHSGGHPWVIDVSEYPTVEDLYLAADVLITDYSSAMFDYAHLDRPIVIYASDWVAYQAVRGVTFDLMAQPPGMVTTTFGELLAVLRNGSADGDAARQLRAAFRERFCPHRDGRAAERVVTRLFPFVGAAAPTPTSPSAGDPLELPDQQRREYVEGELLDPRPGG
jgi:CDP-glycerol glycerophosphotransferase